MSEFVAGSVVTIGSGHPCAGERARLTGAVWNGMHVAKFLSDGEEVWLLARYIAKSRSEPESATRGVVAAKGKPAPSLFEQTRIA